MSSFIGFNDARNNVTFLVEMIMSYVDTYVILELRNMFTIYIHVHAFIASIYYDIDHFTLLLH